MKLIIIAEVWGGRKGRLAGEWGIVKKGKGEIWVLSRGGGEERQRGDTGEIRCFLQVLSGPQLLI